MKWINVKRLDITFSLGVKCTLWRKQEKGKKVWGEQWGRRKKHWTPLCVVILWVKRRKWVYSLKKTIILISCPNANVAVTPLASVSISCQNLYMFRSLWILQCLYTAVCERMAVHSCPLLGWNEKGLGRSTWRWNFKKWKISVLLHPNMTYWLFRNSCWWHRRNLYLFRQFFMPLFLLCPEGLTVITLEKIFSKFIYFFPKVYLRVLQRKLFK